MARGSDLARAEHRIRELEQRLAVYEGSDDCETEYVAYQIMMSQSQVEGARILTGYIERLRASMRDDSFTWAENAAGAMRAATRGPRMTRGERTIGIGIGLLQAAKELEARIAEERGRRAAR